MGIKHAVVKAAGQILSAIADWNADHIVDSNLDITPFNFTAAAIVADSLVVDTTTLVVDDVNNRVGVGTAAPGAKLDVDGNLLVGGHNLLVEPFIGFNAQDNSVFQLYRGLASGGLSRKYASFHFINNQTGVSNLVGTFTFMNTAIAGAEKRISQLFAYTDGATNKGRFEMAVANGGIPAVQFTIKSSGNVGYGTATPTGRIHVQNAASGQTANALSEFIFENDDHALITLLSGNDKIGGIWMGDSGSPLIGRFQYNHATDSMSIWTNGAEQFTILNNGNTGIGTATPATLLHVVGDTRLGDQATNYAAFSATGDQVFLGTSGLPFGEIYAHAAAADITSVAQNDWDQITAFDTNGLSNNSTPDHTNDHITITKAGKYLVSFHWCGATAAVPHTWAFHIAKNNNGTTFNNVVSHVTTPVAGRNQSVSATGIIDLAVNDTVELWVKRLSAGGNIVLTTDNCCISITQIGG